MHKNNVNIPDFNPPFSSFIAELTAVSPYLLAIVILTWFSTFAVLLVIVPLYLVSNRLTQQTNKVKEYIEHYKATYLDPIPLAVLEPALAQKCLDDNIHPSVYSQYLDRRKKARSEDGTHCFASTLTS